MTAFSILPFFLIAAALLTFAIRSSLPGQNVELTSLLPHHEEINGWLKERDVLRYEGEKLFDYINGGAEIYYEYGFREVVVQDYKKDGHSMSVEIYEMNDPQSAYGIYSFKKSPDGTLLETESEGRLEGYYLNLWKDRYLLTITGFDEDQQTLNGLIAAAKAVESKIKSDKRARPALLERLPVSGLVEGSEKYLKGNLGLFNCYPFSRQDIFSLSEGVKASYEHGYDVYIIDRGKKSALPFRFEQVKEFFQTEEKYSHFTSQNGAFSVRDDKNQLIYLEDSGGLTFIVLGAESPSIAAEIVKSIR